MAGGFDRFATEPIPFGGGATFRTEQQDIARERGTSVGPDRPTRPQIAGNNASTFDPFRITEKCRNELAEFIQLTAKHGVTVLIRFTPYSGQSAEHPPTLRAWAEDLESRNPNVIVARPEVLCYDPRLFFDTHHLGPKGATKFTSFVANEVKDALRKRPLQTPGQPTSEKRPR